MMYFRILFTLTALLMEIAEAELSKEQARDYTLQCFRQRIADIKTERVKEDKEKLIVIDQVKLRYDSRVFGKAPVSGRSFYISMHGGGRAPAEVNHQQWKNQIKLYQPKEGIYVAPRAPTNAWNLWHQDHIDGLFDRLIDNYVAFHGVNPNKVYLVGYSAGGNGAFQLGTRMADRWAGVAAMAGHPGDSKTYNLLNVPFFNQCGGKDTAFKRHIRNKEWGLELDKLAKEDPGRYPHKWIVYPQHGHWMHLDCKQALPWIAQYKRDPWPKKVQWFQDNVTQKRFYWLANAEPKKGDLITAEVRGNTIVIETSNVKKITVRLSDKLVDLDQPVKVLRKNGRVLFEGRVKRDKREIENSIRQRLDPHSAASATISLILEN